MLGKKGRFEHVFLTVRFKKLKPMATPDTKSPKVTKMGSIIGYRIDYNTVGILIGQRPYATKIDPISRFLSPDLRTYYLRRCMSMNPILGYIGLPMN